MRLLTTSWRVACSALVLWAATSEAAGCADEEGTAGTQDAGTQDAGTQDAGTQDIAPSDAADVVDDASAADAADTEDTADSGSPGGHAWYENAVVYELFVRSFRDSDGDGVGDLAGVLEKLDYLNDGVPGAGDDLEVDALWLMPIFPSPSYHGYDVTDYEAVEPTYGTEDDLAALLEACHARGMRVLLDLVINHTSKQHPWFQASAASEEDLHRPWYVWRSDDPGWKQPFAPQAPVWHPLAGHYYYGLFWEGMPDLNFRTPAVVDAVNALAMGWLARGVDGFRIDAARFLVEGTGGELAEQPETHGFFQQFRDALEATRSDVYLVGEAWTTRKNVVRYFGGGDELHQAFDFDLMLALEKSLDQGKASLLRAELAAQASSGAPWSFGATFLSNHDLDRLSFRLSEAKQRAGAALLLTLPGTPYLYYGDELGMKMGLLAGDRAKRTPMAWDATEQGGFTDSGSPWAPLSPQSSLHNVASQSADPKSLLSHYRSLVRLRKGHPALRTGSLSLLEHPDAGVFAMLRREAEETLLVIANLADRSVEPEAVDLSAYAAELGPGPWQSAILFGPGEAPAEAWSELSQAPAGGALAAGDVRVLVISPAP